MSNVDFRGWALYYASLGWAVFPLAPRSKSPLAESHGSSEATTDPARIEAWARQHPHANIGMVPARSGLYVLDIDPRNGGNESFNELQQRHGLILSSLMVQSGSGDGLHLYFQADGAERFQGNPDGLAGLDGKHRGFVVLPPSIHPTTGRCYEWLGGVPVSGVAPEPVPEFLRVPVRERAERSTGGVIEDLPLVRKALGYIDPDSYDNWYQTIASLRHWGELGGFEAEALELAREWSAGSPKHDDGQFEDKWESFSSDRRGARTIGSLFHQAAQAGFTPRETAEELAARVQAAFAAGPLPVPAPLPPAAAVEPIRPTPEFLSGYRLMAQTQQAEHFDGCVWIASIDRIATPRGQLLDSSRFNTAYGGSCVFQLDSGSGGKMKTTDKAWTAFTLSQCVSWPKADSVCFRPECAPQSLVIDGGQVLYNIYRPIETYRKPGDPAPFLDLLRRLLPDERDRKILLTYMASLVRNPGVKFQWWPVLQGAQGNGKTFLMRAVEHCVGEVYSHFPKVSKMAEGSNFNGWLFGKLFVGMEEVYVPKRRGFLESFKEVVTNPRIEYEAKGQDQFTGDNRANGMMATNHRNGVPIDLDDRRYAVFFTAQQTARDLGRDGMTEAYFRDLYDWFNGRNGYASYGAGHGKAIINDYLRTCEIAAEFDPAGAATRAPSSSSTAAAVAESYGSGEAAILQAIDDELAGFRGGWVSLRAAVKVAQQAGAYMSPQAVGRFLESAGYSRHPHLPDGRTNNAVMPDGVKTYLYVKEGSLALNFTVPAEIAKAYTSANLNLAA